MSSSSSEASSADSDSDATAQLPPQRGTTLVSKRKDAFEPPQGAVLVGGPDDGTGAIETGEFDWDSVKDDDVELWLVRVPDSVCLCLLLWPFKIPLLLASSPPFSSGVDAGSGSALPPLLEFLTVERRRRDRRLFSYLPCPLLYVGILTCVCVCHRLNLGISTTRCSMPLHRRPRIRSVRSSGSTRRTICGLSVIAMRAMSIVSRSVVTR